MGGARRPPHFPPGSRCDGALGTARAAVRAWRRGAPATGTARGAPATGTARAAVRASRRGAPATGTTRAAVRAWWRGARLPRTAWVTMRVRWRGAWLSHTADASARIAHQSQLPELRGDVGGADEAFADEDCVGARGDHAADVGGGEEAALADHDRTGRDQREELERRGDVGLKGGEIAVVDPDDAAPDRERLIELGGGVAFDQRREPEAFRRGEQLGESRRLENRDDQEHRVGAGRARLPELVVVDREVLAQERDVDRRTHAAQVVEASPEVFLIGEDRDRVRAVRRVRRGQGHRVQAAGEHAP